MTRRPLPWPFAAVVFVGCYASHTTEEHADAGPVTDAGHRDSGRVADARPDAGRLPSVEPVPGERPSDGPGADGWEDPPAEPPTDMCHELGGPLRVTPPVQNGGRVAVAWHGAGWAAVTHGDRDETTDTWGPARYFGVDPQVTRVEAYATLGAPGFATNLRPVGDEIGIALSPRAGWGSLYFGTVDRAGAPMVSFRVVPGSESARLAHQHAGDRWVIATMLDHPEPFAAYGLDESGELLEPHLLDARPDANRDSWIAEGLGSRTVVAWSERSRLRAQNIDVDAGPLGPVVDLGRAHLDATLGLASTTLRDSVVVSHLMNTRQVVLTFYDPFEGRSFQSIIGEGTIDDRLVGLAGSSEIGLVGACIPSGPGGYGGGGLVGGQGVDFQLVTADGAPFCARIPIVTDLDHIGGCAVGVQGHTFIVAWWQAAGGPGEDAIWARRVTVRL